MTVKTASYHGAEKVRLIGLGFANRYTGDLATKLSCHPARPGTKLPQTGSGYRGTIGDRENRA